MGQFIDLTGKTFGNWKVLRRSEDHFTLGLIRVTMWEVVCICGERGTVSGNSLRSGRSKSCGCLEYIPKNFVNLEGKRFGRLLVVKRTDNKNKSGEKIYYLCECDCGTSKVIDGNALKGNSTVSCGCFNKENASRLFMKNLKNGDRFGRLVATGEYIKKNKEIYWECICDCGNKTYVKGYSLRSSHTTSCGCYRKEAARTSVFKDLTSEKFGMLTVIEFLQTENKWSCLCDCGNTKIISGGSLTRTENPTISCGCLKESLVASELKKYFKEKYYGMPEYGILKNPKTNRFLLYDIYLPKENIFIEVNGLQHYEKINFYHKKEDSFNNLIYRDKLKKQYAEENGIFIEIDLRKIKTVEQAIEKIEKIIGEIKINE